MRRNVGIERSKHRVGKAGREEVVRDLLLFVLHLFAGLVVLSLRSQLCGYWASPRWCFGNSDALF